MSPVHLLRWAGLLAIVSAGLSVLGDLLRLGVDVENPALASTAGYTLVFGLYLFGTVLLLLGMVGLYIHQSAEAGILGVAGFVIAFVGTALLAGALWFELFITPSLAAAAPGRADTELGLPGFILAFVLTGLGWLLFGVATLRAHVYPRWAGVLMILGVLISLTPLPLSGSVFSLAIAWLGFVLFTGRHFTTAQPALGT